APARAGGPEILIGGYTPAAVARVGRWGNGFISGGRADIEQVRGLYAAAEKSWKAAGRTGRPRFVACVYYALGDDVQQTAVQNQTQYYSFMGPNVERMAHGFINNATAVAQTVKGFAGIGADELIFWPAVANVNQIDRLVQATSA
ncbi:MAG: LLM class flavin-dependent oxidoreductase, partial [Chloroflexi bacterium]